MRERQIHWAETKNSQLFIMKIIELGYCKGKAIMHIVAFRKHSSTNSVADLLNSDIKLNTSKMMRGDEESKMDSNSTGKGNNQENKLLLFK